MVAKPKILCARIPAWVSDHAALWTLLGWLLACQVCAAQSPLHFPNGKYFSALEMETDADLGREAAQFEQWEGILNGVPSSADAGGLDPGGPAVPFEQWAGGAGGQADAVGTQRFFGWMPVFNFHHSTTAGRHVGRGLPLEGTSWKNRPYHVDWFLGSLLGDQMIDGRVDQDNELIAGLRLGWDFDHFWGLEWRFGWSDPNVRLVGTEATPQNGSIFLSDVDLLYYPWGDSRMRPYGLLGLGFARYEFTDDRTIRYNATLVTLPFGGGLQIQQRPWLAWRFEILDNMAFGADGLSTQHNVSLTAGMEFRLGARAESYWPWRSSRRIW